MIRISLKKRMGFGFAVITMFMLAMSFYLIFRLNHINRVIDSIMKGDVPAIENGEKLVDCLLEQVRNEKKYIITKDKAFLDLFDKKRKEFLDRLNSLDESVNSKETKAFIPQIKEFYNKYSAMVSKDFILASYKETIPPDTRYDEEKKNTIDRLNESINNLILTKQTALIEKIDLFQKTVHKSTKISFVIILFAMLFGGIFSYFFTRSICSPIKALKEATDRIAQGDLDYRIVVKARDEIGTLGTAFNQMCNKLKELDEMKSEFISNISHNLKTPLTSIREANELMLDKIAGQVSEPQVKLLNITKESTLKLIMMINDLLDISKVEAGLMRYNFQYSNIQDVILKSIEDIRFLAESKNIHIHYTDGVSIPEMLLDREKIAQVMDNIFSNAIKYTPTGGSISIKVKEVEPSHISRVLVKENGLNNVHSFVQVSILDTGVGIQAEYHKKIFERFQQVNGKGKGGIKGTGLGLYIAKHIILDHGGDIWVESNAGNGSTFNFTLPSRYESFLNI